MIMRRRRILIFLLVVLAAMPVLARPMPQSPADQQPTYAAKKDQVKGPRAVAVLEWTAKGPRLVPVCIKIDDQFYDAGLYMAQPVPMSIDNGVIYQVQKAGEPLGDFTLGEAEQTPNGLWVGLGSFDSKADQDKRKAEVARRTADAAKAKAAEEKAEEGDRPVLKRKAKAGAPSDESSKPAAPANSQPTTAASTPPPQPKPQPQLTEVENDPNRPILRRGKPQQVQANSLGDESLPEKKPVPPPPGMGKVEVAVSDAGPSQQHSYKWTWANPEEEQKMKAAAQKLALATLTAYAGQTNGPKPGALEDVKIDVYDLNYSNAPTVILSARVLPEVSKPATRRGVKMAKAAEPTKAPAGFEYYVTVVGREDIYGELQKELAVASDNRHLDAFPRMQLIDVVDVDGNGAGDLLFQSTNDESRSFVVYRDLGWSLQEVIRVPEPKV